MDLLKISLYGPSTGSIVAVDDPPALNMTAIDDLPDNLIETLVHAICVGIYCMSAVNVPEYQSDNPKLVSCGGTISI